LAAETGISQGTLYRHCTDDVLTLADAVRERNDRADWTDLHELLAQVVESISVLRIEAFLIAGVPRSKLPEPHHIRRPGEAAKETPVLSPREFARLSVVR
jgi:hypothetical protein